MKESEFWTMVATAIQGDCDGCPAKDLPCTSCADFLRRAHAKTQPPWVDLLVGTGCPPVPHSSRCTEECYSIGDCDDADIHHMAMRRKCWLAYLKDKYGWEVVE